MKRLIASLVLMSVVASPALAAEAHEAAHSFLGLGPVGWLAVGMILFIALAIYMKAPAAITSALDAQIAKVKEQLAQAQTLRREAEALLADIDAKKRAAEQTAQDIIAHARQEAADLIAQARVDGETMIARRSRMADERIAAAERAAVSEVQATAATVATSAARQLIAERLEGATADRLVDQAIADLDRRLH